MTKKRPNECKFCTSRRCYDRIVTTLDPTIYDEIACGRHQDDLVDDARKHIPEGMKRSFISSSGDLRRGDPVPRPWVE